MYCLFEMCIISFDESNFSVLLAAQFRSSGNTLTSFRGRVACFESPLLSVVVWTYLVFSGIFRDSTPFRPGQLASTAFTINYSLVILLHRLSSRRQINDKLVH
jgi:hypothetical protein